ncbi:hypothetical protein CLAIMM_11532 [Cladophialophora immunda]|nr:hypothetical protein CLAIMM_11532 [Cladophialophora immunda]
MPPTVKIPRHGGKILLGKMQMLRVDRADIPPPPSSSVARSRLVCVLGGPIQSNWLVSAFEQMCSPDNFILPRFDAWIRAQERASRVREAFAHFRLSYLPSCFSLLWEFRMF